MLTFVLLQSRVCFSFQLVAAKQLEQACHASLRLFGESKGQMAPFPQMYPPPGELTAARLASNLSEGELRSAEKRIGLISRRLSANLDQPGKDEIGKPKRFTTLFVHAAMDIDGEDANNSYLEMLEQEK